MCKVRYMCKNVYFTYLRCGNARNRRGLPYAFLYSALRVYEQSIQYFLIKQNINCLTWDIRGFEIFKIFVFKKYSK